MKYMVIRILFLKVIVWVNYTEMVNNCWIVKCNMHCEVHGHKSYKRCTHVFAIDQQIRELVSPDGARYYWLEMHDRIQLYRLKKTELLRKVWFAYNIFVRKVWLHKFSLKYSSVNCNNRWYIKQRSGCFNFF